MMEWKNFKKGSIVVPFLINGFILKNARAIP